MGFDGVHNKDLVLELGLNSSSSSMAENNSIHTTKKPYSSLSFEPSLTLALSSDHDHGKKPACAGGGGGGGGGLYRQDSLSGGGSSFSAASVSVIKREREVKSEDSERVSQVITTNTSVHEHEVDEDDDGTVNGRKKLRLTKAQSVLLEEAFKHHSTLNPKQKQELARELKLRPRQVEVWFQNRRARTKLKQTEVDCEYLKKCCEALKEENSRLLKELQELKALKLSTQPLYMQLPAATLTMCPSCERIGDTTSAAKSRAFTMAPKPQHVFNPFTNSSAAC